MRRQSRRERDEERRRVVGDCLPGPLHVRAAVVDDEVGDDREERDDNHQEDARHPHEHRHAHAPRRVVRVDLAHRARSGGKVCEAVTGERSQGRAHEGECKRRGGGGSTEETMNAER